MSGEFHGSAGPPLRGRAAEVETVHATLRKARDGQAALITVRGEPGIGKTAIVRSVLEHARALGFATASASAHEDDRITPLASLAPALRFGIDPLLSSREFLDLAGVHDQPLWLAERLATLLEQRASDGPVLIAVDDAQWCDPLTVFVLRVLPTRLIAAPVVWLFATRAMSGGDPVAQIVDAALPDLRATSLELGALTQNAVLEIAGDRLGGPPGPGVARRLTAAQGNPFLAVEIAAGLVTAATVDGRPARLPPGLVDGVRRRMALGSAPSRDLVRTAAVLGSSFSLADAGAVLGIPAMELTTPLLEAIEAGLLTDDGDAVRFRHDLLREAVYESVPPSARRAIHHAVADHLVSGGRGWAAAAPHAIVAAEPGDRAAITVLRNAAHEVLDTMSVTSVAFIRQAFDLTTLTDPERGEIGTEVVAILLAARQSDEAVRFADDLLAVTRDADLRARVQLLLAPGLWATGRRRELADRTRDPGARPPLDARLAGYRALADGTTADGAGSDPVAALLATTAAAEHAERDGDYAVAHDLFATARTGAHDIDEPSAPGTGELALRALLARARLDDIAGALAGVDGATDIDSWLAPRVALLRGWLALGMGLVEDAGAAAATARALMSDVGDRSWEAEASLLAAVAGFLRGDPGRTDDPPLARALTAMSSGEAHGARDVVAAVTADDRIVWPEEWLVAAACSAHHRGDGDTVDRAAGLLDVSAHRNAGIASVTGASLLVTALSTRDYEPALARLADSPRALLATMAQEEFGRFQLTGGDRSVAVDALDAAHDRYTELGATAWATRARRLLQAAGVRRRRWQPVPQRPDSGWEALTTMERQVATLIANGHTNRSAADELTLSPNTVSTHLRSVFTKLDVHSRVQLANLVRDPQE